MKNNLQKCHIIKSVSKHNIDKSKIIRKKISNTLINHTKTTKKTKIINIKRILTNRMPFSSKYKTSKNSRKNNYDII